jgi:hypothetical protein
MKEVIELLAALAAAVRDRLVAMMGKEEAIQERLSRYASPQDPVVSRLIRYCS